MANLAGGGLCVSISPATDPGPRAGYQCSPDFPSARRPLLDESVFGGSPQEPVLTRLEGFAADGVARVAVITDAGERTAETAVEDNVYLRTDGLPSDRVRGIVALDSAGAPLYTYCIAGGGCT